MDLCEWGAQRDCDDAIAIKMNIIWIADRFVSIPGILRRICVNEGSPLVKGSANAEPAVHRFGYRSEFPGHGSCFLARVLRKHYRSDQARLGAEVTNHWGAVIQTQGGILDRGIDA